MRRTLAVVSLSLVLLSSACSPSGASGELPVADKALEHSQLIRPRHSPDGAQVAYFARPGATAQDEYPFRGYGFFVAPAAGGAAQRLGIDRFDSTDLSAPSWSPDGARVAILRYPKDAPGRQRVDAYELADGSVHALAEVAPGANVRAPTAWSPDGKLAAVCWQLRGVTEANIVRLDGRGRGLARVKDAREGWASAAFDASSERLALVASDKLTVFGVHAPSDRDGVATNELASVEVPFRGSVASSPPLFLPGGQRVACRAGDNVWIVDLASARAERIFAGHDAIDLVLAPGGAALYALLERNVPPSGVFGAIEVILAAGHAPDRYERTVGVHQLASGAEHVLPHQGDLSLRDSFIAELDLNARTLQAFSRWR